MARPTDFTEALRLMAEPNTHISAGGTDIFPAADRLLSGSYVDVSALPALSGIDFQDNCIRISAGVTWAEVATANLPPASLPNPSTMRLGLKPDGRLTLFQGAVDRGQGSSTVIAQMCADALGVPLLQLLDLASADTDQTRDCGETSASRQTFVSPGPFDAKGIGEQALIPTPPGILNAIHHTTGVRVTSTPATPDRLRAAILALHDKNPHV